jgi:DNA end-binding protein Ku
VTDDELKAMEGEVSKTIDIAEFVPLEKVDPIYFERTYYLGPDKGGEKPYHLLAEAMVKAGQAALAKFIMRGKETLVLIRAVDGRLVLHTMYFADEVRSAAEIAKGDAIKIRDNEIALALQLINGLASEEFRPEQYRDEYRERVTEMIQRKVEGQEVTTPPPAEPRAQVIDLMDALQKSLARAPGRREVAAKAAKAPAAEKRPLAKTKRAESAPPARKAQGGRK